jgi:hypothetical protein
VKVFVIAHRTHNLSEEAHWVSRLRENLTSGSDGEGLETGRLVPRQPFTRQTAFQRLAQYFNSEISTLGYPRAALFGFCVALVSYIAMSVVLAAIGSVHGADVVEKQISGYYLANEIAGIYLGMMIAIDSDHWIVFRQMSVSELVNVLQDLAKRMKLAAYKKHSRGPKKAQPKRKRDKNVPHVSTAKILSQRKK